MINITFCTSDHPNHTTGVNSWLKRIIVVLRETQKINPSVFVYTIGTENHKLVEFLRENDFTYHVIPFDQFTYTEEHTQYLLKYLQTNTPDIFVPGYVAPAWYAVRWLRKAGIPSIGMMHSDDEPTHKHAEFFLYKKSKWQYDSIVPVSDYLYLRAKEQNTSGAIVKKIPYGVPVPDWKVTYPSKNQSFKLIYLGRFVEYQKRISLVTQALCEVTQKYSGQVEAWLYGSGPEEEKMRQIIASYGGQATVHIGGFVDSESIYNMLKNAHAIVLLSDYEGLPVSIQEAMACGVVPICLQMDSGANELIQHEENGLIVHDRGESFFNAIGKLVNNQETWEEYSYAAKETIKNQLDIKNMGEEWIQLCQKLCALYKFEKEIKIQKKIQLPSAPKSLAWRNKHQPTFWLKVKEYIQYRVLKLT